MTSRPHEYVVPSPLAVYLSTVHLDPDVRGSSKRWSQAPPRLHPPNKGLRTGRQAGLHSLHSLQVGSQPTPLTQIHILLWGGRGAAGAASTNLPVKIEELHTLSPGVFESGRLVTSDSSWCKHIQLFAGHRRHTVHMCCVMLYVIINAATNCSARLFTLL